MHFLDQLSNIDYWAKHHPTDPAAVTLSINVDDCYHQLERGRPLRPSSIRWIQETFQRIKDVI